MTTSKMPSDPQIGDLLAALATLPAHDPARFETTDGLDNPDCTNAVRADFAAQSLSTFQKACEMEEEIGTATADLICDLLHLLHANDLDLLYALQTALQGFLCEAGPLSTTKNPSCSGCLLNLE
jgi:hypothetical protein